MYVIRAIGIITSNYAKALLEAVKNVQLKAEVEQTVADKTTANTGAQTKGWPAEGRHRHGRQRHGQGGGARREETVAAVQVTVAKAVEVTARLGRR